MPVVSKLLHRFLSLCDKCDSTFLHSPLIPCATRSAEILRTLRTNDWKCDATDIRTIISDGPREIARYDRELNCLRGLYQKVLAGRNALQKFYDHCTDIIKAPIRCLLNEVTVDTIGSRTDCLKTVDPTGLRQSDCSPALELTASAHSPRTAFQPF
ncbi:hypothetical protein B0H13DRAFT_2323174 [Mycena leptocephala]|nr:hypothetical protein B0H13DRAFT_2323174 [Mycena leptocephala]